MQFASADRQRGLERPHMNPPEAGLPTGSTVIEPVWSRKLGAAIRGLVHAGERDWLLAWDANHWLYLLDQDGHRQGQAHFAGTLTSVGFAQDGSAIVAGGNTGQVVWLTPDLMRRWEKTLPQPCLAVAIDPFGQYAAVSDRAGNLTAFNRLGDKVFQLQLPRPLHHLTFVPAAPILVGCADLGLVVGVELTGNIRWRDGLFANAGSLTSSGDGGRILVACYSEGLQCYDWRGEKKERLAVPEPCRLAAISFSGQFVAISGLTGGRLHILDTAGKSLGSLRLDHEAVALAMSPLADRAMVGMADGTVGVFRVRPTRA